MTFPQNHGILRVGKDSQDQQVQPSTEPYHVTKPNNGVSHPVSWTFAGMGSPPLPVSGHDHLFHEEIFLKASNPVPQ